MRILLQDATTGLYLNSRRNWTPRQQEALAFRDEVRARDYSLYHGLARAVVVRVPNRTSAGSANSSAIPRTPPKEQPQVDLPMKTTKLKKTRTTTRSPAAAQTDALRPKGRNSVGHETGQPASSLIAPPEPPAQEVRDADPPLETSLAVKFDAGFGNQLFVRGEGNGLTWDKGEPMQCVGNATWIWSTRQAAGQLVFKVLLNDAHWSAGDNYAVEAGQRIEVAPQF